jgi:hypothetical protein
MIRDAATFHHLLDAALPLVLTLLAAWFTWGSAREVERKKQRQWARKAAARRP